MTIPDAAILVVDDNEDNRYTLLRRLEREGYRDLATAADGREALDRLAAGAFDLVLLDVMMPELDGIETLARIKADPGLRHVPVVMISAATDLERRFTFRLFPDGTGTGEGPDGVVHTRFRTWKEALRDTPPA